MRLSIREVYSGVSLFRLLAADFSGIYSTAFATKHVFARIADTELSDYTTQEYFDRKRESFFRDVHAHIAMSCVTYLSLPAFADAGSWILTNKQFGPHEALLRHPLFRYAVFAGFHHAADTEDISTIDTWLRFLNLGNEFSTIVRSVVMAGLSVEVDGSFRVDLARGAIIWSEYEVTQRQKAKERRVDMLCHTGRYKKCLELLVTKGINDVQASEDIGKMAKKLFWDVDVL